MSSFIEDMKNISGVLLQGVSNSGISVAKTIIETTAVTEAQAYAHEKTLREIIKRRNANPEFRKLKCMEKFIEWCEERGNLFSPEDASEILRTETLKAGGGE